MPTGRESRAVFVSLVRTPVPKPWPLHIGANNHLRYLKIFVEFLRLIGHKNITSRHVSKRHKDYHFRVHQTVFLVEDQGG